MTDTRTRDAREETLLRLHVRRFTLRLLLRMRRALLRRIARELLTGGLSGSYSGLLRDTEEAALGLAGRITLDRWFLARRRREEKSG